ncbi:hypothetical protein IFR05_010999 [Cadophora sp. M221]|nr:hypothetical protein IFR05_010999 [Cadophora sp. M221]
MHQSNQILFASAFLLSLPSTSTAKDIGTCVDVNCPVVPNSSAADCKVVNQTFTGIGIVDYTVPIADGGIDLSWTRVFYIGTSLDEDLNSEELDYAGCRFYIKLPQNRNVAFDAGSADSPSPSCGSVPGNQSILNLGSEIISRAMQQAQNSTLGGSNTCSSIASSLQSNFPGSCSAITSPQIHGFALTGSGVPDPISQTENSTSNCHPTIPRTNRLTRVASYKISASVYYNETAPAVLGETPVRSFFWKKDGTNGSISQSTSVNFHCLFASAMTAVGNNTQIGNDTGDDTGSAGDRFGSGFGILGTVSIAAFVIAFGLV